MDLIERVQYKAALLFPGAGRGLVERDYMRSLVGSLCQTGDGLDV